MNDQETSQPVDKSTSETEENTLAQMTDHLAGRLPEELRDPLRALVAEAERRGKIEGWAIGHSEGWQLERENRLRGWDGDYHDEWRHGLTNPFEADR